MITHLDHSMTIDLITATSESFAPYVGDVFHVDLETETLALTLDNIKIFVGSTVRDSDLTIDGTHYPARKAFALTFEGPRAPVLNAEVMTLRHDTLGTFELLVSPFRQDHSCMLYEVAFN